MSAWEQREIEKLEGELRWVKALLAEVRETVAFLRIENTELEEQARELRAEGYMT